MNLDIPTLFVLNAFGYLALGLLFTFYGRYLRTYPGFRHWTGGALALGAGLFTYAGVLSSHAIVDVAGDALVFLAVTLRFDGAGRFLGGGPAPRRFYLAALPLLSWSAWFTFVVADPPLQLLGISAWVTFCAFALALAFLRAAPPEGRGLHRMVAVCITAGGALALARLLATLARGEFDLLNPAEPAIHILFFAGNLMLDFAAHLGFLLLTARRVEDELAAARDRAVETIDRLEALRAEAGLLGDCIPLCSRCRRVRDDDGFWKEAGRYLESHSAARFPDSTCPACRREAAGGGPA